MCAKFGSDWFRNVNLYMVQTNIQTNKHSSLYIKYAGWESMNWIYVAQDGYRWWVIWKMVWLNETSVFLKCGKISNSSGTATSLWGIFGGKIGYCDRSLFQYFGFPPYYTHTHTRQQTHRHPMDSLAQVRQNKINITWVAYKISLRLCT